MLNFPARPANLDEVNLLGITQTKVGAGIGLRQVSLDRNDILDLTQTADLHEHPGSDRIRLTIRSFDLHRQPVVMIPALVAQQTRIVVQVAHQDIDVAIVVVIRRGRPPAHIFLVEILARIG